LETRTGARSCQGKVILQSFRQDGTTQKSVALSTSFRNGSITLRTLADQEPRLAADDLKQKSGGIEGLPTTLLYDRDGMLRNKVIGFEYTDIIESELKPLL
jgi:hypothetical protein